jgi:exopolysaccharide biosynthesis polyprenyl glycosylphosphotransferase
MSAQSNASAGGRLAWETRYARRLLITDIVVIAWAVVGAQLARFGLEPSGIAVESARGSVDYSVLSVALIALWLFVLAAFGTRDPRVVGTGPAEYRRIAEASLGLFGFIAIAAYLSKVDVARGYVLLALPIGLGALLVSRWLWRQWLGAIRRGGQFSSRSVVVGSLDSVRSIANELIREPAAGFLVVGAVVPGSGGQLQLRSSRVPLFGELDQVASAMDQLGADTAIVTGGDELTPHNIRRLSWALEPGRRHLVVAPGLIDVGGPRIRMRPVAGLPLMHVETPRYEGAARFWKRAFDLTGALALLVVFSPVLLGAAIAIRASSRGRVLFRQVRVGYQGQRFTIHKFRTMQPGAVGQLDSLRGLGLGDGNGVLFKLRDDPRVTRVGRVLRRWSIDELPQLVDVVRGTMSLVGPRPPLVEELERFEPDVERRFLVKPGMTGLWQISGRSDLSWEDSVRLDLSYVENWSITADLVILWRTARAVIARRGAY